LILKRLVLQELSYPELEKYLDEIELAIVPTGSQEQHGPNLTFSTDTDRAYELGKLLGEKLFPKALICAPVTYGVSYHHMKFPGTITLQPETFSNILVDIAKSIKHHGINKILFLNAHGGNRSALGVAITKIQFELEMQTAWIGSGTDISPDFWKEKGFSDIRGHACEGEVSQSMYLAPWLVKEDQLEKGQLNDTPYQKRHWWGQVPWKFDYLTANGALGDATKATRELGEEMTNLVLKRIGWFVNEYFFDIPAPDENRI
jgi:creatinine amidohydrolase